MHIGLPKAGSTGLQKWCHVNRDVLQLADIDYPNTVGSDIKPNHQFLIHELNSNNFSQLDKTLRASRHSTIFFSMEGLSTQFHSFTNEQFSLFRGVTSEVDLIIFMVRREWYDWVNSCYKQCLINPPCIGYPYATELSLEEFSRLEWVGMLWELPNQPEILRSAFGATEIVVASFEQDWASDWSCLMGISTMEINLPRLNEALAPEFISLVQEINRAGVSFGSRNVAMLALQNIANSNISVLKDYQMIPATRADIDLVSGLFAEFYFRGLISNEMHLQLVFQCLL